MAGAARDAVEGFGHKAGCDVVLDADGFRE